MFTIYIGNSCAMNGTLTVYVKILIVVFDYNWFGVFGFLDQQITLNKTQNELSFAEFGFWHSFFQHFCFRYWVKI